MKTCGNSSTNAPCTVPAAPRSCYWDNIKGILILLTVFAHILYRLQYKGGAIDSTVDFIYMFHMPAFVFVSGYFGKSDNSHSFRSIVKLIVLFFIFNSVMGFIYGFSSLLKPVYSYWYLVALIVWRLTAHHIAKLRYTNLVLFAAALFAGFFPSIDNTFAAARIIGFYPFYMAGYLLSGEQSRALTEQKPSKRILKGLASLLGAAVLAIAADRVFLFSNGELQMFTYSDGFGAFGRIALFAIAFLAIYALRCLTPDVKIPLLTMFGKNSLWIFLFHRIFTLWISDWIEGLTLPIIYAISVPAAIIICLAFGNDYVGKAMNKFAESCADLFSGEKGRKTTVAKVVVLLVALGFVVSALLNSYAGYTREDILKFFKGEYTGITDDSQAAPPTSIVSL